MKEEFYIGNVKVIRDENNCAMYFIPRENTKEEVKIDTPIDELLNDIHKYLETNLQEYTRIHEAGFAGDSITYTLYYDDAKLLYDRIRYLESDWEDLKKWLVEKSDACRLKGTATESLRWGTYDEVLNKMIGLEGRDK